MEQKRGNVYYLKPKTTVSRGEVDDALNSISDQGGNKILRATLCKRKLTQLEIKKSRGNDRRQGFLGYLARQ